MEEVYNFIRKEIGLSVGDTIVVGVSGGPDSMALLYILNEFKNKMDLNIVCAHVHHNKRKESEQEKIDLENYCKQNNIPLLRIYYKEFYAKGNYKNIILNFINTL